LADHYGLETHFDVEWLPAQARLKRYDFAWQAVSRAHALRADVVYDWPLQAGVVALLRGLPVLLEIHGEPEGRFGPTLFRFFLRLRGKKRLLPITHALGAHLEKVYRVAFTPGEVVIGSNGVDLERYQGLPDLAEARRMLGLPEITTAGYTGHLYPGRGIGLLVELARRYPHVHFLWVGGRPEDEENWRRELASQSLANVSLTGFVPNSRLPLYQAAADILLMPYERAIAGSSGGNSADYCSPMKMFEYMACGRAILSSDLPVLREVLNESNAVLCPPEDTEAWDVAFGALLDNSVQRQALGCRARQDVAAYTWQARAGKALEGFW
jgi:glycosyltransferase involved in cell wall biosynthesis